MRPVTMRVGRHRRLPVTIEPVEPIAGRDIPIVRITLPTYPLPTTATMHAPDWDRIVAMFNGDLPGITPNGNGRSAKGYFRTTLPPGIGERKGQMVMVSHLVLGLDEMADRQVQYLDGNPLNLCRDNLKTDWRGATAPDAED
ncbi:hypothetical protein G3576_10320 [Roseomonas stagni]|uniref:Uncharacterized protein n=1 Tax=Falsiroseomonas algicola TaxID=2716930 RepID=A0A6M1LJD9_9PROT|nr:hypothetical protein [Falsiroseomonas algicola]NGM20410.1 hypothetical protein [Falsiroseomonas algicola]